MRVVEIDGQPWFVAADVCRCLGLSAHASNGAYTSHLRRLPDDEKRNAYVQSPTTLDGRGAGRAPGRNMTLCSESGLYRLIMRSDKPEG